MNDALNAKLSRLIYVLTSDDPKYLSKADAFNRLLLLVRGFYWMLDETEGLRRLVFRLYYSRHCDLTELNATSPNNDADALRLKRQMIYSRIAERIGNYGKHLSVALKDAVLENGVDKSHYMDETNAITARFDLARDEAILSAIKVEKALRAEAELPTVNRSQNATSRYNGDLRQTRTQEKIENYSATRRVASMQVSRMRSTFPHIKQFAAQATGRLKIMNL